MCVCLEIKEFKNTSIATRKLLNENTKLFRATHLTANNSQNSVQHESYLELLKNYQEEIDR